MGQGFISVSSGALGGRKTEKAPAVPLLAPKDKKIYL
jgi:hypothetical protein